MSFTHIVIDPGPVVLCDLCNADHTIETKPGGFLFASKGVCPDCAPRFEAKVIECGEQAHITMRADPGETFRDFVFRVRKGQADGC